MANAQYGAYTPAPTLPLDATERTGLINGLRGASGAPLGVASSSSSSMPHDVRPDGEPDDPYHLCWWVCCLLGVGILFPWNAFITAFDYFQDLWGEILPIEFYLGIVYNWPNLLALLVCIKWAPLVSVQKRTYFSFVLFVLCMAVVPIACIFFPVKVSLALTLSLTALAGLGSAISFGSVLGLTAAFPATYTSSVMIGNGIAGVIVGLLRIVTKISLPDTEAGLQLATVIYFSVAAFILFLCIVGFYVMLQTDFAKFHLEARKAKASTDDSFGPIKADWRVVLYKVWQPAFLVTVVFYVTLSLFPGMTLEFHNSMSFSPQWFGIIMIFIFQCGDFTGRSLPDVIAFVKNTRSFFARFGKGGLAIHHGLDAFVSFFLLSETGLWIPVMARLGFFALFIMIIRIHGLWNNWIAFAAQAAFAVSNGFLGTLCMMVAPARCEVHEKETAGIIMSFFLNLGILWGCHYAFLVGWAVSGVSPTSG